MQDFPPTELASRVAAVAGKRPIAWRRTTGGYSSAERWVATFAEGDSAFVKAATDAFTREAVRDEYEKVYSRLQASFLPRFLAYDGGDDPLLMLEDLSHAQWPPPWRRGQIEAVLALLRDLRGRSPDWLPHHQRIEGWTLVAADPAPFLSLRLCTEGWLTKQLPVLLEADAAAVWEGHELNHFDVRSDNLCFDGDRLVLLDWNHACLANGEIDLAFWLPSLVAEGGPAPEAILPDVPALAATVAGFYAARAGVFIPSSPSVWEHRQRVLRHALPWAVRALDLPPLDGPDAPAT